jgi:uncharacterized damage-inducible protein DinB
MTFDFTQENTASRQQLEAFLPRLSPADLARTTPTGWTVAALLAHLAYWDQRMLALLRRWQANGVDLSPVDADAVNDALQPLSLALEPQAAVELCLASARAVDAALEAISPALVEHIQASENHFRFNRALHRMDHLNEIEKLIAGA